MEELNKKNFRTIESYPLVVFNIYGVEYKISEAFILTDSNTFHYYLKEVELDKKEKEIFYNILKKIKNSDKKEKLKNMDFNIFSKLISPKIRSESEELSKYEQVKLKYHLFKEYSGFGKIDSLLHDSNIKHILCEGLGETVKIYHTNPRYSGVMQTNIIFKSKKQIEDVSKNLKIKSKKVRDTQRYLGFMDKDKKIEIVYGKNEITISKISQIPQIPQNLIKMGVGSPKIFSYLKRIVDGEGTILVVGNNAINRITLINSLAMMSKKNDVVSLENFPGISLPGKNWIQRILPMYKKQKKVVKETIKKNPELIISSEIEDIDKILNFASKNFCLISLNAPNLDKAMDLLEKIASTPAIANIEAVVVLSDGNNGWPIIKEIYEIYTYDKKTNKLRINPIFFNGKQIKGSKLFD